MSNKMERFTPATRGVLSHAQAVAEQLKHPQIMSEHLLIGITQVKEAVAFHILSDFDIVTEKLIPFVRYRIPQVDNPPSEMGLDLSPEVKKSLELSVDVARKWGDHHIDSIHLLMGLIRLNYQGIEDIWEHFQVDKQEIVKACEALLSERAEAERSPTWLDRVFQVLFGEGAEKKKRE